jgi:hypothetical protein
LKKEISCHIITSKRGKEGRRIGLEIQKYFARSAMCVECETKRVIIEATENNVRFEVIATVTMKMK